MDLNSTRTAANTIEPQQQEQEAPKQKYGAFLTDYYSRKVDTLADEFKDPERLAQHAYAKASDNNVMDYDTWKAFHGVDEFVAKAPEAVAQFKEKQAFEASQPEERGFLSGSAAAIGRGVMNTVGATGQAIGLADLEPASIDADKGYLDRMGEGMTKWAEDKKATTQFMRPTKEEDAGDVGMFQEGWGGALESLSMTGGVAASAAAGAGIGSVAGPVGTAVGATIGGLVGMAGLFGAGTYGDSYDRTYKELKEKRPGATEDEIRTVAQKGALIDAGLGTGSELVSDLAALMTLGGSKLVTQPLTKTLKEIVKPGFKTYLLNTAKHMPFEVGSEVATAYGQADWREKEGLEGGDRIAAMGDAVLPAIFMSAVLGTAVAGYREATARKTLSDLNADDASVRVKAAEDVAGRIMENTEDKELAQRWVDLANEHIASGEKFDIDQTVTEWAATKTREDAQATGRKLAMDFDPKDVAPEGVKAALNPKSEAERLLVGDEDITPEEMLLGKEAPSAAAESKAPAGPNEAWLDQEEERYQREQAEASGQMEDLDAQWASRIDEQAVVREDATTKGRIGATDQIRALNREINDLVKKKTKKGSKSDTAKRERLAAARAEVERLRAYLQSVEPNNAVPHSENIVGRAGQTVATSPQVTAESPASSQAVGNIPGEAAQDMQQVQARGAAPIAADPVIDKQTAAAIKNLEKKISNIESVPELNRNAKQRENLGNFKMELASLRQAAQPIPIGVGNVNEGQGINIGTGGITGEGIGAGTQGQVGAVPEFAQGGSVEGIQPGTEGAGPVPRAATLDEISERVSGIHEQLVADGVLTRDEVDSIRAIDLDDPEYIISSRRAELKDIAHIRAAQQRAYDKTIGRIFKGGGIHPEMLVRDYGTDGAQWLRSRFGLGMVNANGQPLDVWAQILSEEVPEADIRGDADRLYSLLRDEWPSKKKIDSDYREYANSLLEDIQNAQNKQAEREGYRQGVVDTLPAEKENPDQTVKESLPVANQPLATSPVVDQNQQNLIDKPADRPSAETVTAPVQDEASTISEPPTLPEDQRTQEQAGGMASLGQRPTIDEQFDTMVKDAARWQGAARNLARELKNDKRASVRLSKITTKGDLDAYLMRKYGIDEIEARSVSNHLTAKDIPADMTATVEEFKDEPWAKEMRKENPKSKPAQEPTAAKPHGKVADNREGEAGNQGIDRNAGMRKATKAGLARVAEAKKAMAAIVNNPDIVGKDRADRIENARNLVHFLETNAANDLDTGYEQGDMVVYTGEEAPEGMLAFIYLEGAKAGKTGVAATKEARAERDKKAQEQWQKDQEGFRRIREAQQQEAPKSDAEQAKDFARANLDNARRAYEKWNEIREDHIKTDRKERKDASRYIRNYVAENGADPEIKDVAAKFKMSEEEVDGMIRFEGITSWGSGGPAREGVKYAMGKDSHSDKVRFVLGLVKSGELKGLFGKAESKPVTGRTRWFVDYSETNKERTTETKSFATLAEAREFAKGKSGYISKQEDAGSGLSTDATTNTFKEYFGGFDPSAQEGQKMKAAFGEVPAVKREDATGDSTRRESRTFRDIDTLNALTKPIEHEDWIKFADGSEWQAKQGYTSRGWTLVRDGKAHPTIQSIESQVELVAAVVQQQEAVKTAKPAEKIEDFGEKIEGAKKDLWTGMREKMTAVSDDDIGNQPFSKTWPLPDYQAMIESGVDKEVVAYVRAMRDAIPNKPGNSRRSAYKAVAWEKLVKDMRSLALSILDGNMPVENVRSVLSKGAADNSVTSAVRDQAELYMLVGHEKSLAGLRIEAGEYSLLNGVEYKPAKVIWAVEQKQKATAFSNFPRMLSEGSTREEAIADFVKKYESLSINEPASKQVEFVIYSYKGKDGFFIGKKIGRNHIDMAGPFATAKEAREYKRDKHDALLERLAKFKEIPNERRDTNEPRVGEDMRGGKDVTPEMFTDAFGFRGVQFGNYVEGSRRQEDLNEAYDALMDMAAIIGVPPKALSLNGELGLAFGARGSGGIGAAAAHYEPDNIVINLTKKRGAGSIGHEWFHALDNYFSRLRNEKNKMMTDATDVSLVSRGSDYFKGRSAVRDEMIEAFGGVMKAVRQTAMKARATKLDNKRTKEYWTLKPEMSARAFESYLISKLHDQNASNDYLANIVSEETWKAAEALGFELEDSYPYPTAGEVPAIRAAFDNFFNVIESKETDKGVALYQVKSGATPLVETQAFKKWFGKSKARGVFYHWTNNVFDSFSKTSDIGFHFGTEASARDRGSRIGGAEIGVEPVEVARIDADTKAALDGTLTGDTASDLYALLLRKLDSPRPDLKFEIEKMTAEEIEATVNEYKDKPDSPKAQERAARAAEDGSFRVVANGEVLSAHKTPREARARADKLRRDAAKPMAVYLRVENPIRLPDLGVWPAQEIAKESGFTMKERDAVALAGDEQAQYAKVREILMAKGYDGIVYTNQVEDVGTDSYIVFDPTQIKSATSNRGTFDPADPRIQYQKQDASPPSPLDLRAAFPWADSIEEQGGRTIITKGKVSFAVEQVEQIIPDEAAFKLAYGRQFDQKNDQIAGDYRGGTIRIAKIGDNWTAKHEHYHFLEDMGLITKFEQAVLDAAVKKAEKAGTLGFAPSAPAENRAYFVQHALEKRDYQRKTTLGRVLQKIADFVDALVNLVHRTSRGVVRDVESGKVMGRDGNAKAMMTQAFAGYQSVKSVDTPAFKKWFGDSKAVDENGNPLVVYHGTPTGGFEIFDPAHQGRTGGRARGGFSFTTNRAAAETYANAYSDESVALDEGIMIANAAMNRANDNDEVMGILRDQFDATDTAPQFYWGAVDDNAEFADYLDEIADAVRDEDGGIADDLVRAANVIRAGVEAAPQVYEVYLKVPPEAPEFDATPETLGEVVANLDVRNAPGRAAVINMPNGEKVFYVADPGQIKAVNNRGTFDPADQRIQYSLATKARELASDIMHRPEVFGPLKFVQTQYHKKLKNADYGRMWDRVHEAASTQARSAARAAQLAPDILPDHAGSFKETVRELMPRGKNKITNEDLRAVSRVMSIGTLAGKDPSPTSGHRLTDDELSALERGESVTVGDQEIRMTKAQVGLYRQARKTVDQMVTEMAASEAWRNIRGALTEEARGAWRIFAENPGGAEQGMNALLDSETRKAEARLARAEADAFALGGVDNVEDFGKYGDGLRKLRDKIKGIEKFTDKQKENGDLDAIIAKRQEEIDAMADKLGIDADNVTEELKDYVRAAKELKAASGQITTINEARESIVGIFEQANKLISAGYVPLSRFGKYRINVHNKDGKLIYVGMYDTSTEGNMERRKLVQAFAASDPGATVGGVIRTSEEAWKLYQGANPDALMLFASKAGAKDHALMQAYYRDALSSRSALKRLIARKGYAGYSEDLQRILASFITSGSKRIGTNYHSADITDMLGQMKEKVDKGQLAGDVLDEAVNMKKYVDDPGDAGSGFRSFAANWYMLGSFMSAAWNGTQVLTSTLPELYKHSGSVKKSFADIFGAYRTMARKGADLTADESKALKRAEQDGTVDAAETFHLWGLATKRFINKLGNGEVARKTGAFLRLWGMPFAWFETVNRKASFIAAYRQATDVGMKGEEAYAWAKQIVDITQGVYQKHNRVNVARSAVGGAVMTFMQYKIMTLEQIARNAKGNSQAKRAAALQLAIIAAMGGWSALPGAEDIMDLLDAIMQIIGGEAWLTKKNLREAIEKGGKEAAGLVLEKAAADAVGQFMADFVNTGISTILPFDVQSRAGMDNIIPGVGLLKPSTQYRDSEVFAMAGVPGSMVESLLDATSYAFRGDIGRAAMRLAPNAVAAAVKGANIGMTGEIRNNAGKKIADGNILDAALQGFGAQPKDKARIGARLRENQELKYLTQQEERSIVNEWADAYEKRGVVAQSAALKAVRERIAEWNRKNPEWPIAVKQSQVMRELQNRRKTTVELAAKSAPKELRKSMAVE